MSPDRRRNLSATAATVVALGLLLGGGAFLRTSTIGEQISERNLRELARMARAVEGQVNNVPTVLGSLVGAPLQPRASRNDSILQERAELIPGLAGFQAFLTPCEELARRTARTVVTGGPDGGVLTLRYVPNGCSEEVPDRAIVATAVRDSTLHAIDSLTMEWSLAGLAPALESDYFSNVLLADASGRVFLSPSDLSGIRVHDLASLRGDGDSVQVRGLEGSEPPGIGFSTIRTVSVAGDDYRLFVQPVRVALTPQPSELGGASTTNGTTRWLLAGLVPVRDFRRESLALGPTAALSLGTLMVLTLLAAPFLRVSAMGPRERLRVRHLLYIFASLLLASGLMGLAIADLAHYGRLADGVHDELDGVAALLTGNLEREIDAVLEELQVNGAELRRLHELFGGPHEAFPEVWMRTGINTPMEWRNRNVHMQFWTDSAGMQLAKWTWRSANTPRVSVARRAYFRTIWDGLGWPRPATAAEGESGEVEVLFVESIRSLTTGERLAVVSTPYEWYDGTRGVAGAVVNLSSLDRPVLPPGTEFAVVDREGRTLFHSRKERNLEEDFAGETSRRDLLRSVLAAHTDRHFDATYRGRASRLFVRPVAYTPLSVILIRNEAQLTTVHFETLFVAGVLALAYALVLIGCISLSELLARNRLHWVWPDLDRPKKHVRVTGVLLLYGAAFVAQAALLGSPPHPSFFVFPLQAIGLTLVALSAGSVSFSRVRAERVGWGLTAVATLAMLAAHVGVGVASAGGLLLLLVQMALAVVTSAYLWTAFHGLGWLRRFAALPGGGRLAAVADGGGRPGWLSAWDTGATVREQEAPLPADRDNDRRKVWPAYAGSVVLGLTVFGALPGYLAYELAFEDRLQLAVQHHQVALSEALRAREARRVADPIVAPKDTLRDVDLAFAPLFATLWPATQRTACTDPERGAWARDLNRLLADRAPWLSEEAVGLRQLSGEQQDRCWAFEDDGRQITLVDPHNHITSSLPAGLGTPTRAWWAMLLATLALFWVAARWLAHRVFLVTTGDPEPVTLGEVVGGERELETMVIVCMRSTSRRPILDRDDEIQYVDLLDVGLDEAGKPRLPEVTKSVVCLDRFDHRTRDASWSGALLSLLEELVYVKQKKVILLTSREPGGLFDEAEPEGGGPEDMPRRWARLLGQFTKVNVADQVPAARLRGALDEALEEMCARLPEGPERAKRRRRLEELHGHILRECGPTRRLQAVGRQILTTPGYEELTPGEIVGQVREAADPYYRAVWAILSDEERLVVAQLAAGAIVNPQSTAPLHRLLTRGLVIRDPSLRLMNRSFQRFVRDTVPDPAIRAWEEAGTATTWETLRGPLVIGWVSIALFLFWTQRDVLGNAIAFLSTAGVGLAAVIRLFTMFDRGSETASTKKA